MHRLGSLLLSNTSRIVCVVSRRIHLFRNGNGKIPSSMCAARLALFLVGGHALNLRPRPSLIDMI